MSRRSPAKVIGSRLLQALPVIVLATFMVFALLKLVPGDIAVTLAGDNASDARIAEIQEGLRPRPAVPGAIRRVAGQGRAGRSLAIAAVGRKGCDVDRARLSQHAADRGRSRWCWRSLRGSRWGWSLRSSRTAGSIRSVSMIASLGVAIPGFWLAMILVAEISLKLNWLPATGAKSFTVSPWEAIRHALLPGNCDRSLWHGRGGAAVARLAAGSAVVAICADAARQGPFDDRGSSGSTD